MIELAVLFLLLGLVSAMLGFTKIAGASFAIAKIIAVVFLVLFLVFMLLAWGAVRTLS